MKNISFGQVIVLIVLCFLLFGDFFILKKKLNQLKKQFYNFIETKNRKKGS